LDIKNSIKNFRINILLNKNPQNLEDEFYDVG